mgnify:FL=1|jgi:hypothetical protein|tara:strand:+ start:1137 stop:1529 length:393 start_codon:yes stop_codon:yes gene_type:complete
MATEILINDGGAPARILPYVTAEAITAGDACTLDTNGLLQKADSDDTGFDFAYVGVALTDAASGAVASVVTGVGVILNINCDDVGAGVALMMGATEGRLTTADNGAGKPKCQAVTLENNAAAGLTKCQTL